MEYNIRIHPGGTRKVSGKKIILKNYPELNLFGYDSGIFYYICEYKLGISLGSGPNQKTAKSKAIENLESVGIEKFKMMVEEDIREFGCANC